jgi:hypothetical protein
MRDSGRLHSIITAGLLLVMVQAPCLCGELTIVSPPEDMTDQAGILTAEAELNNSGSPTESNQPETATPKAGTSLDSVAVPELTDTVVSVEGSDDPPSTGDDCLAFENDLQLGKIKIAWPEWRAGEPLPITFKFPGPVPGLEDGSSDYKYSVKVSDTANGDVAFYDLECKYLGYTGKLHCFVPVHPGWEGTIKAVELTVSDCGPIYQNSLESLPFMEGGGGSPDDHHEDDHHHDEDHQD